MPALTELTRATAIASGRWSREGEHCDWVAWARDPSAGKRKVVFYSHGGAETDWENVDINSNTTYLMLVNDLNTIVISYDTSPGFFRVESGEGTSSKDIFEKQFEHMAAIAYLRRLLGDPANGILPSGMWISVEPNESGHGGGSSGAYDVLRAQLTSSDALGDAWNKAIRGEGRFSRAYGHECNFLVLSIPQVSLSQFHEYYVDPAIAGGDTTYLTNTPATVTPIGSSTIALDGDTKALFRGNRIIVNVAGTNYTYAVTADYAGGPGSVSIFPLVKANIPDNTPVVFVHEAVETYGKLGWASQYLFSAASGYVWRSDDPDGFPMEVKRQADVDLMLDVTNPRVHDIHVIFNGADVFGLITSALVGEQSFLETWDPGFAHPAKIDLHGGHEAFYVAYWLWIVAGNTTGAMYVGSAAVNVNVGDPSVPWNTGLHGAYDSNVAKLFFQNRGW
jgi:hypothetical protein